MCEWKEVIQTANDGSEIKTRILACIPNYGEGDKSRNWKEREEEEFFSLSE